ncbi:cysteine/histidine-rich C1 domain protein [Gossypium australe]|uniref:Cysteine/histidine-rich C1 domain protein n=1 Tax=Gossypium australe TaxID=47621 RepID=A0A5B6WL74_9ROSI|nr:cysteine/histidine-rich C1 domain protein [Gossypium australe]
MPGLYKQKDTEHQHELDLETITGLFICNGCKELGFGNCYKCPGESCNYVLHVSCLNEDGTPLSNPLFKNCKFQFHRENPLTFTSPLCDTSDDLLPSGFRHDNQTSQRTKLKFFKSKCLKCDKKNRSSNDVQCLSYVSSDGKLCYHVACMKEACRDNWDRRYFRPGSETNEQSKFLALKNLAPKTEGSSVGQTSEVLLIRFLKLVVYAILGEPFDLIAPLFQPSRN